MHPSQPRHCAKLRARAAGANDTPVAPQALELGFRVRKGSFQRSMAPIWTPNSRALVARAPEKKEPQFMETTILVPRGYDSVSDEVLLSCNLLLVPNPEA